MKVEELKPNNWAQQHVTQTCSESSELSSVSLAASQLWWLPAACLRMAQGRTNPAVPGGPRGDTWAFWTAFPSCTQARGCRHPPSSAGLGPCPAPRHTALSPRTVPDASRPTGTACTSPACTASACGCGTSPRSSAGCRSRRRSSCA